MRTQRSAEMGELVQQATADHLPPYDRETEREMIRRAQQGDAAAEDGLVRTQALYVCKSVLAWGAKQLHVPLMDAYQDGLAVVLTCVRKFDAQKAVTDAGDARLNTLVSRALPRKLIQLEPTYWPGVHVPAGESYRGRRSPRPCPVGPPREDFASTTRQPCRPVELADAAEHVLSCLSPQVSRVLRARFGLDGTGAERTATEYAAMTGLSPRLARNRYTAAQKHARLAVAAGKVSA